MLTSSESFVWESIVCGANLPSAEGKRNPNVSDAEEMRGLLLMLMTISRR